MISCVNAYPEEQTDTALNRRPENGNKVLCLQQYQSWNRRSSINQWNSDAPFEQST